MKTRATATLRFTAWASLIAIVLATVVSIAFADAVWVALPVCVAQCRGPDITSRLGGLVVAGVEGTEQPRSIPRWPLPTPI